MNNQQKITGESIKEQISLAYSTFQKKADKKGHNTFVLDPDAVLLNKTINSLRNQCPHEYTNGICIYCGNRQGEAHE